MVASVKLGLAPTRRDIFSKEDAWKHKGLIEDKLDDWDIDYVNIDWLNDEGLLYDDRDASRVAEYFKEQGVDGIFCPHVNFGTESAVGKLGSLMDKPLLLWGPRDDAPLDNGSRTRDTQCGLFASSKVLRRFNVPFTYVENSSVDSRVFARGFKRFLAVVNVIREFRGMRIGQISTRPEDFWTVIYNEGELLEKFGIEVVPDSLVNIIEAAERIMDNHSSRLAGQIKEVKQRIDEFEVSDKELEKLMALKLAMLDWAEDKGLSGIAIQCWHALQNSLGILPCFANAELTDLGIPVACETDVHGAITAVMARAARMGETAPFIADLTVRHPDNDNGELLWHCGPFPHSLKAEDSPGKVGRHFIFETHDPGVAEWQIKGGELTITRFDGDHGQYRLFSGKARGTTGPRNRGTYLWVEVDNWPAWEKKFIYGPYIHHVIGIHGDITGVLEEATRYIPHLEPDSV